jgi:predicted nucleotide-binding protein
LELGFFIGKFKRSRVCVLYKKGVDYPSDIDGLGYIEMDDYGAWKGKIVKELQAAGLKADANRINH